MKYSITQTENYLLIVDDSEIKEGDWYLPISGIGWKLNIPIKADANGGYNNEHCKKIISHLPLNDSPILKGVDLLPEIEDDIEQWAWDNPCLSRKDVYTLFEEVFKEQRLDGEFSISAAKQVYEFKKKLRDLAKQKVEVVKEKYKYTEKDMIEYSNWVFEWCSMYKYRKLIDGAKPYGIGEFVSDNKLFNEFQKEKSFEQPKMPVAFEFQSKLESGILDLSGKTPYEKVGQTVWVGKYIFND
jgi:hypothetical protein